MFRKQSSLRNLVLNKIKTTDNVQKILLLMFQRHELLDLFFHIPCLWCIMFYLHCVVIGAVVIPGFQLVGSRWIYLHPISHITVAVEAAKGRITQIRCPPVNILGAVRRTLDRWACEFFGFFFFFNFPSLHFRELVPSDGVSKLSKCVGSNSTNGFSELEAEGAFRYIH
jgi:hypothetical protein